MDDGAPKLPSDLEQPVTSSTPQNLGDVGPTPPSTITPPPPPVNPTPTTPPPSDVPEESPKPIKPKSNFKKNFPKIAGGLLAMALLIGGIVTGNNLIQQRTQVEQQAATNTCLNDPSRTWEGECKAVRCPNGDTNGNGACDVGDIGAYADGRGPCDSFAQGTCVQIDQISSDGRYCEVGDGFYYLNLICGSGEKHSECRNKACDTVDGTGENQCKTDADCGGGSGPSPSSTANTYSCVDLTKKTEAPVLGDIVEFKCDGKSSANNPVAFFRYNVDGGDYTKSSAINLNDSKNAKYSITIDQPGAWKVQCRICTNANANNCTGWGRAN